MDRPQLIVAGAVVAVAALAGLWFGSEPEPPPVLRVTSSVEDPEITVHVAGEVIAPGLVKVPAGARVADAIAAAGGFADSAEPASLNLAAPLVDGQQVVVGGPGGSDVSDGKLSLNQATASELENLAGVGPVLAARIVDHRDTHGPFTVIEDLLDVPGIGEAKLASFRESVVVP